MPQYLDLSREYLLRRGSQSLLDKVMMAEEQIAPNESGIDGATKEERDVRDRADKLFRPLRERLDREVQEFCLEEFVHICDHL
jgi:hypothetical protein